MGRQQKTPAPAPKGNGGSLKELLRELWEAAVTLRGSIEPADYKRYVLPIIFLRFLSLRYDRRRAELERLIADPKSDYHTADKKAAARILNDPDEYQAAGAFIVPEAARWANVVAAARRDDVKLQVDNLLELLETTYPKQLRGLLPRIYAGSNLDAENLRGLINLFAKDVFERDHGGTDLIGRVYEYFIGEFASSEGKRGGEYFTPESIVRVLVAMLEPKQGTVFDPCCGSGGMFVQSDIFTKHTHEKADLSILDDNFLQTFKDRPQENLRLKLLEQLVQDEIHHRKRKNLVQAKSFQELLQKTLQQYHNRLIDAAAVIKALLEMRTDDERAKAIGLEPDELAFYDAVAANYATLYEPTFLRDLIHDVVQTLKSNLKVEWASPDRQQVYAQVRAAVRRVLVRNGVKSEHLVPITLRVMEQAATTFGDWPLLAV